jgi:coproporphyrinogen III oxidase-like Fe-S oxidoreductase
VCKQQVSKSNLNLFLLTHAPGALDQVRGLEMSLERAVALNPTHLSVYDLIVEEGTAFWRWWILKT